MPATSETKTFADLGPMDGALTSAEGATCPSCRMPFDKGKKRKLIDACGHERCYSCMFNNDRCPLCSMTNAVTSKCMDLLTCPSRRPSHVPEISLRDPAFRFYPPCSVGLVPNGPESIRCEKNSFSSWLS